MGNGTENKDLQDFENARSGLAKLSAKHPSLFAELKRLVQIYNATADRLRDMVKAEAKETGKKVYIGPFTADPKHEETYDIPALKDLLNADEFESVVKVEYSLTKEGKQKLAVMEEKYPQLATLKADRVFKVMTPGPKNLDLTELDTMG